MTQRKRAADPVAAAVDRGVHVTLLLELRRWYASQQMHEAMRCLRTSFDAAKHVGGLPRYYQSLLAGEQPTLEKAEQLNDARRQVSHFFLTAMTLCRQELLGEVTAANVLGPDAISFFLEVVEPLDQMHRRCRLKKAASPRARLFYTRLQSLCESVY